MANELQFNDSAWTGSTLYVVVWNEAGQAWNGSAFATYTTTRGDFDIAATEISGTGFWRTTFPGTAGYRRWSWYLQAGGSPSHANDIKLLDGIAYWDGTNLVSQGSLVGDIGGKVLGGGSGTITGVGARADNRDGQDIATPGDQMNLTDGAITANKIASAALTAAKFASGALDSVWTATTRLLTAGTNIVLAKGTGITGFNDLSQADVRTATGLATANLDTQIDALLTSQEWSEIEDGIDDKFSALQLTADDIKTMTDQLDFSGAGGVLKSESTNMRGTDNSLLASSYSAPPTAQQIRDAMKLAPSGGAAATNSIDDKIDEIESGSGVAIPVIQVPVPSSRTWILKPTSDGLRGELPLVRSIGEHQPFAVDFRHDLSNNGRLISLESISFVGPDDGIAIDVEDRGVDRSEAKFVIELLEAGTYVITLSVEYDDSDGGGTATGEVTLIVK